MKKTKLVSILFAVCLIAALSFFAEKNGDLPFVVSANANTYGNFTYTVEDGEATITGNKTKPSGTLIIPDTLGGYPVTSIDYGAFYDCTGLTSITIPDSVKSIGEKAFYKCTGLKTVTIGNSVTSIGDNAFYDCTGLTSITIPDSVTSIGDCAFYDCTGLTSVSIGNSVTSIDYGAFSGCTGLTSITIPDSVTSIGSSAFYNTAYYNNSANWKNGVLYISNYLIKVKNDISGSYTIKSGTKCIADNAFYGCTGLTSVKIGNSVTSIGDYAFYGCPGLKSITIPDSVTSIGSRTFSGCTGLTSVTIGNSVKNIGGYAFYECTGLTSITIGNSVKSIGWGAFSGCTGLTSITIPDSVTSIDVCAFSYTAYYNNSSNWENGVLYIGKYLIDAKNTIYGSYTIKSGTKCIADRAFSDCTGLTSITIPDSVTNIGGYAFHGCTGLTSIKIPNSVTSIGYSAFSDCTGLTSIKIPDSVTSIGDHAFYGCTGLTSITIPDSVKSIGGYAFYGCTGLTSIKIPDSVTSIGDYAFCKCTGLKSITIPDSVTSIGRGAFSDCMGLTSITIPNSVKSIGRYAFYECTGLTSITIPDSVKSIGGYAFYGCTGLTSITIPDSVTSIGDYAFDGCTGLTSITIGNSVQYIGDCAFYECTGLTSITIPDSVTSIGDCAFYECTRLTSITIGNSVTSIGESAFGYCTGLTSITIPDSVTSIGWFAFRNCPGLTSITIGNGVESIGGYTFRDCTGLTSITIPDSVTSIGDWAFECCTGLTSITIGNSVTSIGDYAFADCTGLTSITIPDSVTSICYNVFYGCTGLTSVTIGNGVDSIGDTAFQDCHGLKSVTIGNSVTSIGGDAFYECSELTSVTMGNSVTSIGNGAFEGCTGLTSITIPDSVTSIGGGAFGDCDGLETVYYSGSEAQWNEIDIGSDNYALENAKIHYNTYTSTTDKSTAESKETGEAMIVITPRMKNSAISGKIINSSSLSTSLNAVVKKAKASVNAKTYSVENNAISVTYTDGKNGITVSADKYNDYIIPAAVASSYQYNMATNSEGPSEYAETIYMRRDIENGKPYISSVYAKTSGKDESYANLLDGSSFTIDADETYDIIVTAGNVTGTATYYIAQDGSSAHTLKNTTGVFSSQSFSGFDSDKTIYCWVVASNGGSETEELKASIKSINDNAFIKALKQGNYSIGGKNGISITFPKDWVLIGGKSLNVTECKTPVSFYVDPSEKTVKIALGLNIAERDFWSKGINGTSNSKWEIFKQDISGLTKERKELTQAKIMYKLEKIMLKLGVPKSEVAAIAEKKSLKFESSVYGYLEGTFVDGELVIKEGQAIINASLTVSFDGQYAAFVYGISGGADGSFGLTASRSVCSNDDPINWNLKLSLEPNIKAYAGVGIQKLASLSVYGKTKLPFNWSFTNKQIDIAFTGEVGIEAKLLFFKTSIKLFSGKLGPKYFYYGQNSSSTNKMLAPSQDVLESVVQEYTVSDRDYADNTSEWLGEENTLNTVKRYLTPTKASSSATEFTTLQKSVYDNSNAQIITCGDTTIAAWVEDDSTRDAYNRTRLVYSIYNSSSDSWSEPKAVYSDGYTDAAPSLATDGSNIYITWSKFCKKFTASNSTTLASILGAGEIYFAKYNFTSKSFDNVKRLTNNSVYDYSPIVTVTSGVPTVYYCRSTSNSMSSVSGNSIYKYTNGKTTLVKSSLATVQKLASNGSEIAYAVDTDGDITTTDDVTVYYGKSTFTAFKKVNDVSECNCVYADFNGKSTLFVSDGGNIYYMDSGELKTVLEETENINSELIPVTNGNNLSFFWLQENEKGNSLITCNYTNNAWSGAVELTQRESKLSNVDIAVTSGGKFLGICSETILKYNSTNECYEDSTTNLVSFKVNNCTDIEVADVYIAEESFVPGETTTAYVTLENKGNTATSGIKLILTDDYGTQKTLSVSEKLVSGKSENYEIEYTVPAGFTGGKISVNAETSTPETDVDNNSSYYSISDPRLILNQTSLSRDGDFYSLDATITNDYLTTAKNVTVKTYFGNTDNTVFDTLSVGDVSRDVYKSLQFTFTKDDIVTDSDGTQFLYLVAEDEDGNSNTLVVSLNEDELVCGHPLTENVAATVGSCTVTGYTAGVRCTVCDTYISGHEPTNSHKLTKVAAKSATCTKTGNKLYYKCSVCSKVFLDAAATQETTLTAVTISATGHNTTKVAYKASTCTVAGNNAYYYCTKCKKAYIDSAATRITTAAAQTRKLKAHSLLKFAYKAATCTMAGYEEYYKCKVCAERFKDSAGTVATTLAEVKIAATGHNITKVAYKASTCTVAGNNAYYYCTKCNKAYIDSAATRITTAAAQTRKLAAHKTYKIAAKAATCTKAGNTAYYKCSVCSKIFVDSSATQETTLTAVTVKALGHDMTKYPNTASTCTTKGHYTYYICNRCKNVYVDAAGTHITTVNEQTRKTVSHKIYKIAAKSATCTTKGNITYYKCSVCSKRFLDSDAMQETTLAAVTIKAKCHYWGSPKVTKAATCTTAGTKNYKCARTGCTATKTTTIAATGHKLVKTAGVAPTCTTKGYWTYYTCSVCGKVFSDAAGTRKTTVAGQVRNATGHSLTKVAYKAATATTNGNKTYYKCSKCSKLFLDSAGTKETTLSAVTIKATGK